jgi:hypothetical protein
LSTVLPITDRTIAVARIHVLRRIFSFPAMLSSLLAMLAVVTVRSRFDDPDMWWHLKNGEVTWANHAVLTTDLFAYTNHHAVIPHEWLSELLIYGAYRLGGYSGLMLWLCFFTAALLIAGYALCWLYSGNAKVAFVGGMTIWLFGTIGFAIRPHMIGYLLLIVELLLLHLGQTRNRRWFLGLPPLFAIWINCHGSFFFGLALAGAFLFTSWFSFHSGYLVATRWDPRNRRTLILALALSVAALFLNPVGVKLVLYPLNTMLDASMSFSPISEWQPLQFTDGRSFAFLGILGCIFLLVIVRRTELLWQELVMLAIGTWFAASHVRMLFVFGILAAPVLSRLLSDTWDGYNAEQDRPLPNAVLIAASLLLAFLAFPNRQNLTTQVEEHSPVKAVEFIKTHHLSGPMLNEWDDGGYLIWAAPEHPVFIDGRGDGFDVNEFGKWTQLQSDPNTLLDKYGIRFCLLSRGSPMVTVLHLLPGWQVVYSDNLSVIVARSAP